MINIEKIEYMSLEQSNRVLTKLEAQAEKIYKE